MLTDVFIRVFSSNELRLGMAIATVARWKMQQDVRVTVLQWDRGVMHIFDCDKHRWIGNVPVPFAAESLRLAEELAKSDPYIISNDDCLIYGSDFVQNGLRMMREHPEFGIISGVVTNGHEQYSSEEDVHEIHAVGGLVFLRKGLMKEWPPLEDGYWDVERHRQILLAGKKSGYSKWLPYLHLGARFSVASPAFWTGAEKQNAI